MITAEKSAFKPSQAALGWCFMKALARTAKQRFTMMRMYYR